MPRVHSDRNLGLAALTVGAIALFISLNGDAWAARAVASLSKGSVKSVHIADSTIRSADIATGGVRGTDVKNGTLGLLDLDKTLAAKIVSGGPSGPAGPPARQVRQVRSALRGLASPTNRSRRRGSPTTP